LTAVAHKKEWVPKKDFHPGGEKGKLHRELGIAEDQPIPAARLQRATHSRDPEVKRDAKRAETMKKWKKKKRGGRAEGAKPPRRADRAARR
jgi:hypothetical protein